MVDRASRVPIRVRARFAHVGAGRWRSCSRINRRTRSLRGADPAVDDRQLTPTLYPDTPRHELRVRLPRRFPARSWPTRVDRVRRVHSGQRDQTPRAPVMRAPSSAEDVAAIDAGPQARPPRRRWSNRAAHHTPDGWRNGSWAPFIASDTPNGPGGDAVPPGGPPSRRAGPRCLHQQLLPTLACSRKVLLIPGIRARGSSATAPWCNGVSGTSARTWSRHVARPAPPVIPATSPARLQPTGVRRGPPRAARRSTSRAFTAEARNQPPLPVSLRGRPGRDPDRCFAHGVVRCAGPVAEDDERLSSQSTCSIENR